MAIVKGITTTSSGTGPSISPYTTTISHNSNTGDNRLLTVSVQCYRRTVSGITYAGTSLTQAVTISNGNWRTYIYYLIAPATGANNLVITWSGYYPYYSLDITTWLGVAQTTPLDQTATATGSSKTGGGVNITPSQDNEVIVDGLNARKEYVSGVTVGAGQTQLHKLASSNYTYGCGSYQIQTTAATENMNWTWSASLAAYYATCAASFKAATGDITIIPSVQTTTSSLLSPTIIAVKNVTITSEVQVVTSSLPSPTVVTGVDVTVTPSVQTLTAIQETPQVSIGEVLTPDVQTTTVSLPDPTVVAVKNITVSLSSQDLLSATPSVGVSIGDSYLAPAEALNFILPEPTVVAVKNITTTPSEQTTTFSQPTPNVSIGITTSPSVQATILNQPAPTVIAIKNVAVSPTTQDIISDTPSVGVSIGDSYLAPAETLNFIQPSPTVIVVKNITLTPSVQDLIATQPNPNLSLGVSVSLGVQSLVAFLATITTYTQTNVFPDVQSLSFSLISPEVFVIRNITISPEVANLIASTNNVTISTGLIVWSDDLIFFNFKPTKEYHRSLMSSLLLFHNGKLGYRLSDKYYLGL